jgi:hypothetical protein
MARGVGGILTTVRVLSSHFSSVCIRVLSLFPRAVERMVRDLHKTQSGWTSPLQFFD